MQLKGKCVSQSCSLHPNPQAKARPSGHGLGSGQPLSSKTPHLGSGCAARCPPGEWTYGRMPVSPASETSGVCLLAPEAEEKGFRSCTLFVWGIQLSLPVDLFDGSPKTQCFFQGCCQNQLSMLRNQFSSLGGNGFTKRMFKRPSLCGTLLE